MSGSWLTTALYFISMITGKGTQLIEAESSNACAFHTFKGNAVLEEGQTYGSNQAISAMQYNWSQYYRSAIIFVSLYFEKVTIFSNMAFYQHK